MMKTVKKKAVRDYYKEIDEEIKQYELYKPCRKGIDWITDRIDWCWKFRHITENQLEELVDRICNVMEDEISWR